MRVYRRLATQALQDAMEAPHYVCGMQPLDDDHCLKGAFLCDDRLTCADPVEGEFYQHSKRPRSMCQPALLCATCAGTSLDAEGGYIHPDLSHIYKVVLPICNACFTRGEKILVRQHCRTGKEKLKLLDRKLRRAALAANIIRNGETDESGSGSLQEPTTATT